MIDSALFYPVLKYLAPPVYRWATHRRTVSVEVRCGAHMRVDESIWEIETYRHARVIVRNNGRRTTVESIKLTKLVQSWHGLSFRKHDEMWLNPVQRRLPVELLDGQIADLFVGLEESRAKTFIGDGRAMIEVKVSTLARPLSAPFTMKKLTQEEVQEMAEAV